MTNANGNEWLDERQAVLDGFLASPEGRRWHGDEAAEDVAALRKEFNTVHFCFTPNAEAHKRWRMA